MRDMSMNRREWLAVSSVAGAALALADAAQAASQVPIRLSLNENAFGPSPTVARAIAAEAGRLNRYVEQRDADALIAQIAALERAAPEQVILGEILEPLGLVLARRKPGGGIVFSTPGYTALVDATAPLGGRAVPVALNADLANDLPAIERAVGPDTLAVSLVNPHNPSGTVDDVETLAGFVTRVSRTTLVIVDEAYLEYDDFTRRSAVQFVRGHANVLVFRTLAKIYGLAGLSLGYGIGPAALIAELRKAGVGAPHSLNRLSVVAASAALSDQAHVARVRAATIKERERVTRTLGHLRLRHTDSRANFVFFDAGDRAAAARAAFDRAGIQIGRPFSPLETWLRVTIGRPEENNAVIRTLSQRW